MWGRGGAKRTKRSHPHKHAQASEAEVHRSNIDELKCSNEWVPCPIERQNSWNQQTVTETTTTAI